MIYDYYLHRGWDSPIDYLDDLGEPYKVPRLKWSYMRSQGYRATKVPEGSTMLAVVLQAVINCGAHPTSYFCNKAIESFCYNDIKIEHKRAIKD